MKDLLQSLREALSLFERVAAGPHSQGIAAKALADFAQLEAIVREQPQYEAGDMADAQAKAFREGVASVVQQPQAEAVPSDVVCAVAAEREACARQCEDIYSWRGAYSAGPMCTRTLEAAAAAIRARGHAAIAQQKGDET